MSDSDRGGAAKTSRKSRLIAEIRPETKGAVIAAAAVCGVSVSEFAEACFVAAFNAAKVTAETEKLLSCHAATQRALISIADTVFRVKSMQNDGVAGRYGENIRAA